MIDIEFRLALHKQLCDVADTLMLKYNPCDAHDGECRVGKNPIPCCVKTRFVRFDGSEFCYFLGEDGCQMMNIHCKTWFCDAAVVPPEMGDALDCIRDLAQMYGLMEVRR